MKALSKTLAAIALAGAAQTADAGDKFVPQTLELTSADIVQICEATKQKS